MAEEGLRGDGEVGTVALAGDGSNNNKQQQRLIPLGGVGYMDQLPP